MNCKVCGAEIAGNDDLCGDCRKEVDQAVEEIIAQSKRKLTWGHR